MSDVNFKSYASRALPTPVAQGLNAPTRASRYGELFNQPIGSFRQNLADEGCYFVFHNITLDASTTIAGHPAPVIADLSTLTKPLVVCRNTDATTSTKRVYLDYIEIEVITAAASGTNATWAIDLDTGASRYSSGTVETATLVNPNMQSATTPVLDVKMGPYVATSPSASVRKVGFGNTRVAIEFTGDKVLFNFGGEPGETNIVLGAATHSLINVPPVILGPTDSMLLGIGGPSTGTAGVYKIRGAFWER
jgi:hypothetical protein